MLLAVLWWLVVQRPPGRRALHQPLWFAVNQAGGARSWRSVAGCDFQAAFGRGRGAVFRYEERSFSRVSRIPSSAALICANARNICLEVTTMNIATASAGNQPSRKKNRTYRAYPSRPRYARRTRRELINCHSVAAGHARTSAWCVRSLHWYGREQAPRDQSQNPHLILDRGASLRGSRIWPVMGRRTSS